MLIKHTKTDRTIWGLAISIITEIGHVTPKHSRYF